MNSTFNSIVTSSSDTESILHSDTEIFEELLKNAGKTIRYKCKFTDCRLEFQRKDALDRHEHTHTGIKKYKCSEPNCIKAYINLSHLRRHNRTAHSMRKVKVEQDVPCDFTSCPKLFAKRAQMRNHYMQKHLLVKNQSCTLCDAKFYRKLQLKKHRLEHTHQYPYKCKECEKGFLTLKLYEKHTATHKTYKCQDCNDLVFDKWSQVIAHRQTMHRPTCEICQKTFATICNKRMHMKIHQNVEDRTVFWCPHKPCPKFYNDRKYLNGHIRRKHAKIIFECDYCHEKFSTKQKLVQHMLKYHVNGECMVPKKGRRGARKLKTRKQGRYFGQKLSTAAILTGLETSAKIEKLVVNDHGRNIDVIELAKIPDSININEEIAVITVRADGSEQ